MKRIVTAGAVLTAVAVLGGTIGPNRLAAGQTTPPTGTLSPGAITVSKSTSVLIALLLPAVKNAQKPFRMVFTDKKGAIIAETNLPAPVDAGTSYEVLIDVQPFVFGDGSVRFVFQKRGSTDPIASVVSDTGKFTFTSTLHCAVSENGSFVRPLEANARKFNSAGRQIALLPYIESEP